MERPDPLRISTNDLKAPIKVCHVVATADGATWMFEQLRELRDKHEFEVCAVVSKEHGTLIEKLKSENIPYHVAHFRMNPGSPVGILRMTLAVINLARFFRRERFDVVQTHIFITTLTARPAAWLADVPVRTAMIASPFHLQAHTSRWMERLTYWMDTLLIPSCEKSRDLCRELAIPEKCVAPVIYYSPDERNFNPEQIPPADIRAEFGWPPDTPLVCMVAFFYPRLSTGRWVPEDAKGRGIKGHGDLVRAASIILREFPTTKFLLVGSGWGAAGEAHLKEIHELVTSLNLQDSIVFPGYRPDANRILRDVAVAVQPSVNENLGGTIEALMMECPTVATRVGGMVDSVREGETGVLVNPSSPEDLARGIIQLLRDPEQAHVLGRAGRKLMLERFTLRRTASDLAELYDRLLAKEKAKRRFYNPVVSLWRLTVAVPIFVCLVFRLLFVDMLRSIYLPMFIARIRALPFRLYHLLRDAFNIGSRRRALI